VPFLQVDKIREKIASQSSWDGIEVVKDLPGRGRGVKTTRKFHQQEVVCDYNGQLLNQKDGKDKYASTPEDARGYMFAFKFRGSSYWRDATEEKPTFGRLINHSRCHANVSEVYTPISV